jgi:hypothetical protein
MSKGGPFPGDKTRPGCDADYSPHLVPRSRMSRSYTFSEGVKILGLPFLFCSLFHVSFCIIMFLPNLPIKIQF